MALVLVIACANLANLLSCRERWRASERSRCVWRSGPHAVVSIRQLLTESLLISLLGAALGLRTRHVDGDRRVARVRREHCRSPTARSRSIYSQAGVSSRTPSARGFLSVLSLRARASAARHVGESSQTSLKGEECRRSAGRIRRSRFRDALVVVQVAGCLVLLVAAGTLIVEHAARRPERVGNGDKSRLRSRPSGLSAAGSRAVRRSTARAEPSRLVSAKLQVVNVTARALHGAVLVMVAVCSPWPFRASRIYHRFQYNAVTPRYFDVVGQEDGQRPRLHRR